MNNQFNINKNTKNKYKIIRIDSNAIQLFVQIICINYLQYFKIVYLSGLLGWLIIKCLVN